MQPASDEIPAASRRPAALDFAAALLLLATVVLHVVAMAPTYFVGTGSLMSQPDQAALYSVLAASWALALGIGLTGPHRTPVAAAVAVGVAVTELGFRVADFGDAMRYGTSTVGSGLWWMEAAWIVGAAAAVTAVLAARARHGARSGSEDVPASEWTTDWTEPSPDLGPSNPYAAGVLQAAEADPSEASTLEPAAPTSDTAVPAWEAGAPVTPTETSTTGAQDLTESLPSAREGNTSVMPEVGEPDEDPHERTAWTLLVVILAFVVAGAFLPAWDHAVAVSTQTGQTVTKSLGNAFSGPWQQVVGTVLAAVALLGVPVAAIRLRNKAVGAAAVVGGLLVLTSQFVAAVVQVDQPMSAAALGISPAQARNLGLELSLRLTGWFTLDTLAAYALFAAVMVWATLRKIQESSAGTPPSTPERRSEAMRSAP